MSNKSAESRDNSPDGSPEKRASKKRKVLSCYPCRNRKMKCDRIYPVCGRCQKTGRADQCTYDPRLLDDLTLNDGNVSFAPRENNDVSSDALACKVRVQERRLETMERKLDRNSNVKDPHLDGFDIQAHEPIVQEEMMFRGKGFKTQFYGSTSPLSIITQFGELQTFTREALMSDRSVMRIRGDFKTFRNQRKERKKEKELRTRASDVDMIALVPDKSTVDAKVALYFQVFETSYRIFHEPTFWDDYRVFWEQRRTGDVSGSFATMLVLIISLTKCLSANDVNVFVGDSSADRETASDLVEACDGWIACQSRKRLTFHFFQLHCLALFAKRVNCVKLKQDWVTSGDLIRLAMSAGMHRNPSLVLGNGVSEFDKEMRRRLWATIMELELQSSIDCGLPSSICGLHFDAQPPANVPDEELSADSTQPPPSRPIEQFTATSYLVVGMRSLPLRVRLMQLLNDPTTNLQYADVLHYDAQINAALSSLPTWDDRRAAMPRALVDIQLRQFLLMLHRPYAKLAAKNSRYGFSFVACVDAANGILCHYDELNGQGILALNHLRSDVLRIVFALCQVVYHNCVFPPSTFASHTPTPSTPDQNNPFAFPIPPGPPLTMSQLPLHNFLATTLCTSAIALLERARSLYEAKVMRLGTGYMEYWLISASIGILPSATSSLPTTSIASLTAVDDDIKTRVRKAVDRTTALCFRVLAMQKDPGNTFASNLRTTIIGAPSDMRTPISDVVPGEDFMQDLPWGELGMDDMAGWTFPDFWAGAFEG
ncbi:hypothetical protein K504DRAFT_377201 [Pleomassaria siparia CBS 279.74]|uniref:Zn(2)-C6 fungal-type domain-containing protein n=1 Tax=Pleomassaria siparia CBS 279.74 TaxID=1314801 RepID=A0A6G1KD99_9PLEO|nr:hypothetical protein K504DRAFT_377201 [Pleomassaria siparia CBS 279.74]